MRTFTAVTVEAETQWKTDLPEDLSQTRAEPGHFSAGSFY